jgi:pimeloyl-ACP methyl ester carboxylesterase
MRNLFLAILFVFIGAGSLSAQQSDAFQAIPYHWEVKTALLPAGQQIAYIDEGQGEQTLLLIHGLGGYLMHWMENIDALARDFRVLALDLPGYGKSSKEGVIGGMKEQADYVAEFLEVLGLEEVWVAGHSMGGQIAMTLGLEHPQLLSGLLLLAPAGIETFNEMQANLFRNTYNADIVINTSDEQVLINHQGSFVDKQHPAIQTLVDDRILMKESSEFRRYAEVVAGGVHGMVNEPVFDRLSTLNLPVLLIFTEEDALIPNRLMNPSLSAQSLVDRANEVIPSIESVLINGAGHLLQIEQSEKINSFIRDYLIQRR